MATEKTVQYFVRRLKTLSKTKKIELLSSYSSKVFGLEWDISHYKGKTDTKKLQALKERYRIAKREKSNLINAFKKI